MQVNYHVLDNSVIVIYEGKHFQIMKGDPRFEAVIEAIKAEELERIPDLVDYEKSFSEGELRLVNGVLELDGKALPDCLSDRVLKFKEANLPFDYLIKFARKLKKNSSFNSRKMLFKFLEHNGHPITASGNFIAYRGVTSDFKDHHTKTFDNSVGSICEMPREKVDDNPDNTCSHGLHVACYDYAYGFGSNLIEVEVNPTDVVCVPKDYNGTKMRVCKYRVVNVCENIRNEEIYEDFPEGVEETWESYPILTRFNRKVNSSFIERIEYRNEKLKITFKSGHVTKYKNVPCYTANEFLKAQSVGKYYHRYIKGHYFE